MAVADVESVSALASEAGVDQAALQNALTRLSAAHDTLGASLLATFGAGDQVHQINLDDGTPIGQVSGAEFAAHFPLLDWTIKHFDPQNGGLGATASHFDGNGTFVGADTSILPEGLLRFAAWGDLGINYLLLHETAHTTTLGVQSSKYCWDHRDPSLPWPSDPMWLRNEKVANNIYRVVAEALHLPVWATPGALYRFPEPPSFDEETALSILRDFHGDRPDDAG